MALGRKLTGQPGNVYVVLGDGELHEGLVAESSRIAAYYSLSNLIAVLDWNGKQSDEFSAMMVHPHSEFEAWGWDVRVANGHKFD